MTKSNILTIAILVITISTLRAQNVNDSSSAKKDSLNSARLEEVTVTSTGVKQKIQNFASTINFISSKKMEELNLQSIGEAMRLIPGANYLDEDGRGIKPGIGLRGLDPNRAGNTLVVIDGKFPIGQSYSQLGAYYMMPVGPVDRVEVIKGASPVLYGGGSIGGVVNIITKSGKGMPYSRVFANYGSYNSLNAGAETYGNNGKVSYYAGYNRRQGDGFRTANSKFNTNDVTLQLGMKPDSLNEIKVYVNAFTENSRTPGGISQTDFEENYRKTLNLHDVFIGKRFSTSINYTRILNSVSKISASLYGSYFLRDWWVGDRTGKDANTGEVRNIPSGGLFVDYNNTGNLGGLKNSFLAGIRIHGDRTNKYFLVGDHLDARTGKATLGIQAPTNVYEAYVYDDLSLTEKLKFSPGLRYTHVTFNQKDIIAGTESDASKNESLIYSLGLIYMPADNLSIYTTVSRGYQPPAIESAMDPGTIAAGTMLKAETSNSYEIGIRSQSLSWLDFSLSGYLLYYNNKVINESGVNKNAGKSFHRGIEAEINVLPIENLKFYVTGALQKATFANGQYEGNYLPYAPTKLVTAGVRYAINAGKGQFVANVYDSYTGLQYNDAANTVPPTPDGFNGMIPDYNLLNATLSYSFKKLNFNAGMLNILDRHYYTQRFAYWGGLTPSPGRTFSAGMSFKF